MDGQRFDELTRAVTAGGTSRRGVLKALVAAAFGGFLATRGREASAQCEPLGSECATGTECCTGTCAGGKCCPAGETNCNGACVNLKTDENNCNECGRVCSGGRSCCNGFCVNTQISETNCGECGKRCAAGQTCCGGKCVDTETDTNNCGTCAEVCGPNQNCQGGDCCLKLRSACQSAAACCQDGGQTPTTCFTYTACGSTPSGTRCCRPGGSTCTDNCDCCGDNLCRSGKCGAPDPALKTQQGAPRPEGKST